MLKNELIESKKAYELLSNEKMASDERVAELEMSIESSSSLSQEIEEGRKSLKHLQDLLEKERKEASEKLQEQLQSSIDEKTEWKNEKKQFELKIRYFHMRFFQYNIMRSNI